MFKRLLFYTCSLTLLLSGAGLAKPQAPVQPANVGVFQAQGHKIAAPATLEAKDVTASSTAAAQPTLEAQPWKALYVPLDDRPCNWLFPGL